MENINKFISACIKLATQIHQIKPFPGSARVQGDEEEDGDDDIDKEFNFGNLDERDTGSISDLKFQKQLSLGNSSFSSFGVGAHRTDPYGYSTSIDIPLLTYGEGVKVL